MAGSCHFADADRLPAIAGVGDGYRAMTCQNSVLIGPMLRPRRHVAAIRTIDFVGVRRGLTSGLSSADRREACETGRCCRHDEGQQPGGHRSSRRHAAVRYSASISVYCGRSLDNGSSRVLYATGSASAIHGSQRHARLTDDGAVLDSLNVPDAHFQIALPPLGEQRAIAHILGTLDDKIELNRRMNETLEAMARALFKSWFVDFDPVRAKAEGRDPGLPQPLADLFPDSFEDSELGEIPEGVGGEGHR